MFVVSSYSETEREGTEYGCRGVLIGARFPPPCASCAAASSPTPIRGSCCLILALRVAPSTCIRKFAVTMRRPSGWDRLRQVRETTTTWHEWREWRNGRTAQRERNHYVEIKGNRADVRGRMTFHRRKSRIRLHLHTKERLWPRPEWRGAQQAWHRANFPPFSLLFLFRQVGTTATEKRTKELRVHRRRYRSSFPTYHYCITLYSILTYRAELSIVRIYRRTFVHWGW